MDGGPVRSLLCLNPVTHPRSIAFRPRTLYGRHSDIFSVVVPRALHRMLIHLPCSVATHPELATEL